MLPTNLQGRTDRIVFKLFGKDPNDLPLVLRTQVYILVHEITLLQPLAGVLFITWFDFLFYVSHFQILDWLSHSPTDIESYIRPGCIILTIYLCLERSMWEEVSFHTDARNVRLLNLVISTVFFSLTTMATYSSVVIWDPI